MLDRLDRRFRAFAFARHVPPRRILVRMLRRVQARFMRGDPAVPGGEGGLRSYDALLPRVFPPRAIAVGRDQSGWTFTFLARTRRFADDIDWAPDADPAEQLWRMNLHYMEYLEVLRPADARDAILSWIAANPSDRPGAIHDAWNGYALSLRIVCWLQWLAHDGAILTPTERTTVARSLASQLGWLARRPETDLGGNHLVKNIKALAWGGRCFEGYAAERWIKLARRLLAEELPRQVQADGVHFERSPSYHNQVCADLIETSVAFGADTDFRLDEAIDRMVGAATALCHPDGAPAQFGDAGLAMAYPVAQLVAAWSAQGRRIDVAKSAVLPDGGFAAFHSVGFTAFLKCGPVGADSLPAHAHGDVGSVELSWRGARLVVDQGVFEYIDGPRRAASRAAAHHNLTALDGADMADFFGAFRLGRRPRVVLEQSEAGPDAVRAAVSHDGFAPTTVRRAVRFTADRIELEDSISAAGAGWASRFLIAPCWASELVAGGVLLHRGANTIRFEVDAVVSVEPAVWWPDMGEERQTHRLVIAWPADVQRLAMRFIAA